MANIEQYQNTGDYLRELRTLKNKTQKEVAEEAGMSAAAYGFAEAERDKPVNPANLKKLAEYYGVDLEKLEALENKKPRRFGKKNYRYSSPTTTNIQDNNFSNTNETNLYDLSHLNAKIAQFIADKSNANIVTDIFLEYFITKK